MPIYEFKCGCGVVSEVYYSKVNQIQDYPCVSCGDLAERIISDSHFQFSDGMPSYQYDDGGIDSLEQAEDVM